MNNEVRPQMQLPEPDHEGRMAKSELYRAAKMSMKLFQMIQDGQELEGWVQAKITKSADYLDSIYHYMEYQMKFGQGGQATSVDDITGEAEIEPMGDVPEEDDELPMKVKESMNYEQKLQALLEGAKQKEMMKKKPAKKDEKVDEGWEDMMKASKEREKEKGTGKFDKKSTSTGTVYTRKSSTFDDGGKDADQKKAEKKTKKKSNESLVKNIVKKVVEAKKKGSKPDFLDMDKDGNKTEPMKKAVADKKKGAVKEGKKPDFLDLDKDGDKKEPMKKAAADKKSTVKESAELDTILKLAGRRALNG